MNSEARLTRSAMRTRASRGLADELLELPAKPTPSRARSTLKSRLPFDELSNAKAAAPQSGSPVKRQITSQPEAQYQTPAVKGSSTLSDVERMLLSPTPRLTPETSAKAADASQSAKAIAPIAEAEDLAALEAAAAKAAEAAAAAQQADSVAPAAAEQSKKAAEQAAAEAAAEAHAAKVAAEVQAAANAALAEALRQAADAQAAADAAAAEQARLDEEAHAAKVAAEVQAAADAALAEALRQAAEAQAAAEAAPADAAEPEVAPVPVPVMLQTSSDEGSDRWDIDGADDMVIQHAVEVAPAASTMKSKVVTCANFDSRSIRQLKKEIKVQYAKQASISGITDGASSADEDEESVPSHVAAALSGALEGLSINSGSTAVAPLRGVPVAEGQHLRFDDETGEAHEASPMHMPLRGVPPRAGVHLRFDE